MGAAGARCRYWQKNTDGQAQRLIREKICRDLEPASRFGVRGTEKMKNCQRWPLSEGFLIGNNLDDVGASDSLMGVGIGSAFS